MTSVIQDLRHAFRSLRASPGFALAAVLSLALGVGANTSLFTALYAVALRPLPVRDARRVVVLHQETRIGRRREIRGSPLLFAYPEYRDYRDRARTLAGLAAYADARFTLGGAAPLPVDGLLVSCDYFAVLGAPGGGSPVVLGRTFTADECRAPGAGPVVVLGHALWRTRFGADAAVVSRPVTLNGHRLTVVGVAAPEVVGTAPGAPALWVPLEMQPVLEPEQRHLLGEEDVSWLELVGRLRPGASLADARADLARIARERDEADPGRTTRLVVSRGALLAGPEVWSRGLPIAAGVMAFAGLVLLMACANVANLLLARAAARRREVAVRIALGASPRRIVRQLLTESAVLCAAGAALGVLVAYWLPPLLVAALPAEGVRIPLSPDLAVLGYAAALAAACTMIVGLAPALQSARTDVYAALGGSGVAGGRRGSPTRVRDALVVAQVAGCIVLLVGAALLARGVRRGESADPGFATRHVLSVALDLGERGYTPERAAAIHTHLLERLGATPGVEAVALAARLPLSGRSETQVTTEGPSPARDVPVQWTVVSAGYFRTMGVRLVRGRAFAEGEGGDATPAVVSGAMARRLWRAADPLGARFRAGDERYVVTGVAADVSADRLGGPAAVAFYAPPRPADRLGLRVVLRTAGAQPALVRALPAMVRDLDPDAAVAVERIEDALASELRPAQAGATLAAALGGLALLLAAVGVQGVVAYAAARRTRELGIRMALGATRRQVVALVLGRGVRLVALGVAAGVAVAAAASQLLAGLLFGLDALDPVAFAGTASGVAALALLAAALPAARAARLAPSLALRADA